MRYQAELKRIKQLFDIKGKTLYKTEQRFVIFKRKSPFKVMKQKIPKINIQRPKIRKQSQWQSQLQ